MISQLKAPTVVILLFLLTFPKVTATFFEGLISPLRDYSLIFNPSQTFDHNFGAPETLPLAASDAQVLARKYGITSFFLSDGITKDELIYQRIIEALYPLAPTTEASFVFFKSGENILTGCDLLDQTSVVKLARCI